jgi:hypothetical protein
MILPMRAWGIAAIALGVLVACGDDSGNTPIDAPAVDPVDAAVDAPAVTTRIVFLNRNGGTYTVGNFDSVANTQNYSTTTVQAQPYPYGDPEWATTKDCVTALFSPFNVNIVDVDPGAVDHVEVLVTTTPQTFGVQSGTTGIAPATADCSAYERGLALVFATSFGQGGTRLVCEQIASMIAADYGLDWAMHCPDVMTYLSNCGDKAFRDVDAMCGEFSARACRCGGTTQNSYRFLAGRLGLR